MVVTTEEELGRRVQNGDNRIEIEGDLAKYVIRIKATGNVAWVVAFGAIGVAFLAIMTAPASPATGPVGVVVEGIVASGAAAGAVSVLGYSTTVAALSIVLAVKSRSVLKNLRNKYNIVKESENKIVLLKKS